MRCRDDKALARTVDYEAPSATGGDDTCCQHLDNHSFLLFNLDYLSLMLDNHFLAPGSALVAWFPILMLYIDDSVRQDVTPG